MCPERPAATGRSRIRKTSRSKGFARSATRSAIAFTRSSNRKDGRGLIGTPDAQRRPIWTNDRARVEAKHIKTREPAVLVGQKLDIQDCAVRIEDRRVDW